MPLSTGIFPETPHSSFPSGTRGDHQRCVPLLPAAMQWQAKETKGKVALAAVPPAVLAAVLPCFCTHISVTRMRAHTHLLVCMQSKRIGKASLPLFDECGVLKWGRQYIEVCVCVCVCVCVRVRGGGACECWNAEHVTPCCRGHLFPFFSFRVTWYVAGEYGSQSSRAG